MGYKITLARHAGFCYGVKNAVDIALKQKDASTYGPLIHNRQVVEQLNQLDIDVVNHLDDAKKNTLIIRAHGAPKSVYEKAIDKGITIVDATCPYVKKVHNLAKKMEDKGYTVVIVGEKNHPEVIGIASNLKHPIVVETPEEAKNIIVDKIGVVSQTTQSTSNFDNIVATLKNNSRILQVENTICSATFDRQTAAKQLANKSDIMIVIGGKNSGNTRRLYEICKDITTTYHIETKDELKKEWFAGKENIGITAGASTPDYIIGEVIGEINEFE